MFNRDQVYTRNQISEKVGGGIQDCISHQNGRVVAICMRRDKNPQAPFLLLVGKGPQKEHYGEFLCNQQRTDAIPIFVKKQTNAWEFAGYFKVKSHTKDPDVIARQERTAGRNDVYMIIEFEEV